MHLFWVVGLLEPNRLKMPAVRTYKRHFRPTLHAVHFTIPLSCRFNNPPWPKLQWNWVQRCLTYNIESKYIKIYQNTWISWIIFRIYQQDFLAHPWHSMFNSFAWIFLKCIELCEVLQRQKINTLERLAKLTDGQCRPWELSNNFRSGCTLLHLDQTPKNNLHCC